MDSHRLLIDEPAVLNADGTGTVICCPAGVVVGQRVAVVTANTDMHVVEVLSIDGNTVTIRMTDTD